MVFAAQNVLCSPRFSWACTAVRSHLVSGPPRPLVSRHVDADTNGKGKGKRKGKERVMQKEMEQGKEKVNGNEIRDLKFNILLIGMLSGRR